MLGKRSRDDMCRRTRSRSTALDANPVDTDRVLLVNATRVLLPITIESTKARWHRLPLPQDGTGAGLMTTEAGDATSLGGFTMSCRMS